MNFINLNYVNSLNTIACIFNKGNKNKFNIIDNKFIASIETK